MTPRIFINEELLLNKEIKIADKIYHYIANVMRCKVDDKIILINGKDGEFISKIIFLNNKYLNLKIVEKTKDFKALPFLGLIFAPIQKIDITLKSATELGVTDFVPITTEYINKSTIKLNKVDGNIIEAVEQSERLDLPNIHKLDNLKNTLDNLNNNDTIIFFCEERTGKNSPMDIFRTAKINGKKIYALVGPEGGFSSNEKQLIREYSNVVSINLGDTILRAETAAISILSILKAFYF